MRESRTRSIALCGLSIALLAVSGLFTVPLGPVPFTLQTAVLVLIVCVLSSREAICAVAGYLVMGAIGLPVFAQATGGIGILLGPTGGFLFGFLLGTAAAELVRRLLGASVRSRGIGGAADGSGAVTDGSRRREFIADIVSALVLLAISYLLGWAQLMVVASLDAQAAFLAGIAPFIIPDLVKSAIAIGIAAPVRIAIGRQGGMAREHTSAT